MQTSNSNRNASRTASPKADLYARITDRIIADLERGTIPWLKPWSAALTPGRIARPLRHTGEAYRGINVLLLWSEATDKGFTAATWMTYKQAASLGAQVRKGERGTGIVYADRFTKTETSDTGAETERAIPFLKAYTVFNADQIDGLPKRFAPEPAAPPVEPFRLIESAETFFASTGAIFRHGGNRAFYAPAQDIIQLPPQAAFRDAESYAAKAHELIHWTGHPSRLNREYGKRFADTAYAREELTAELGAAFLCATLGITAEPREDHAAYLAHWLDILKADKRAIFTAASHAQRAADFLDRPAAAFIEDIERL